MISGRGLAHTGGTLDKLESIPGFDVRLSPQRFKEMLAAIGVSLIGQTADLVPADRKLYALRDVTATVESYPLIAASIMSKKLAEGIDGLVLDVKTGSGAFMRLQEDAERLAQAMVSIGKSCGKRVVALITDMNQPLGEYVGNSLEVIECLEVLKGRGPGDLVALCEELSAYCLLLGEGASSMEGARQLYRKTIASGEALAKFRDLIQAHGGDPSVVEDYGKLPQAQHQESLPSPASGYIQAMETQKIGIAMCVLGAGRERLDSLIDPAVGMRMHKRIGDSVMKGEPLCTVFYNDEGRLREARRLLLESFSFSATRPEPPALIKKIIQ
jgi:pyrimidine-nucleoside phosphorylase